MPVSALIVDDEPLARKRIIRLLRAASDLTVAGEAAGGEGALRMIAERAPRLVVRHDGTELRFSRAFRERLDAAPE